MKCISLAVLSKFTQTTDCNEWMAASVLDCKEYSVIVTYYLVHCENNVTLLVSLFIKNRRVIVLMMDLCIVSVSWREPIRYGSSLRRYVRCVKPDMNTSMSMTINFRGFSCFFCAWDFDIDNNIWRRNRKTNLNLVILIFKQGRQIPYIQWMSYL